MHSLVSSAGELQKCGGAARTRESSSGRLVHGNTAPNSALNVVISCSLRPQLFLQQAAFNAGSTALHSHWFWGLSWAAKGKPKLLKEYKTSKIQIKRRVKHPSIPFFYNSAGIKTYAWFVGVGKLQISLHAEIFRVIFFFLTNLMSDCMICVNMATVPSVRGVPCIGCFGSALPTSQDQLYWLFMKKL